MNLRYYYLGRSFYWTERYLGVLVSPWLPDFSKMVTTQFWEDTTRLHQQEST